MTLSNVLLASNPGADAGSGGWPTLAGRTWDVRHEPRDGYTGWSLACHFRGDERVGSGTVGWIRRWAGRGVGSIEGVFVFDADPVRRPEHSTGEHVWYCDGYIRRLAVPIAGERVAAHSEWSGAAPYHHGPARQFQCGRRLADVDAAVLEQLLGLTDQARLARMRAAAARRGSAGRRGLRLPA